MKIFAIILLFSILSFVAKCQVNGEWYTFRIDEILCNKITDDKLISYRIGNYNLENEYTSIIDTFTIKDKFWVNDSTVYFITNKEPDDLVNDELSIHKYVFNRNANTLTTFYYNTLKNFYDFKLTTKNIDKKNIKSFISSDTSTIGYVTFYKKDSIDTYISYPRLFEQPAETVIEFYNEIYSIYFELYNKSEEERLPYFFLKGLSKSVLQTPIYLKLKTCPLVERDNFENTFVREKFKNDEAILDAIYKFEYLTEQ